jgi:hypothetical protein
MMHILHRNTIYGSVIHKNDAYPVPQQHFLLAVHVWLYYLTLKPRG